MFGFVQKVAYDPVAGPFTQGTFLPGQSPIGTNSKVRSDHGDISVYMGLPRRDHVFINDDNLKTLLNIQHKVSTTSIVSPSPSHPH